MNTRRQFRSQASRLILAQFNKMMSQEKGTLCGDDIEFLHRMRVASRRLRARIRDFGPLFGGRRYARIQKEVRKITRCLGVARDLDVFADFLQSLSQTSGAVGDVPAMPKQEILPAALLSLVQEQRTVLRQDLGRFFRKARQRHVIPRIRNYFRGHAREPVDKAVLRAHMRSFARQVIQPRLEKLAAYRRKRFTGTGGPFDLHQMRICAKKLRYSMEIFEVYYGSEFAQLIREVRVLQDTAGRVHDLEMHEERIEEFAQKELAGTGSIIPLLECCARRRAEAFAEFQGAWRAFWKLDLASRLHRYWAGAAARIPG